MAGIPGKGGRVGRSGSKPKIAGVRLVRHTVLIPPATKDAMIAAGPDEVRRVLIDAFPDPDAQLCHHGHTVREIGS